MDTRCVTRRTALKTLAVTSMATAVDFGFPYVLRAADVVKLGFLSPISGALAFVGQSNLNCLRLAVDEMNAQGGIGGHKIEVVVEDTQASTKVSLDKARKLLLSDKVDAVLGMVLPFEREAALSVAKQAKKLVFHPNFDEGRCDSNLVATGLSPSQIVEPFIPWLEKNIGKTLYFIASDLALNRPVLSRIDKALGRVGGKVVGSEFLPFGTRDFGPTLHKAKAAQPGIVWGDIGDDPITFIKQYHSFGMKPQFVTRIMHESIAFATDGGSVGALYVAPYFMSGIDTEANRRFRAAYTERYKEFDPRRVRGFAPILPHNEMTYVAARIFGAAVAAAGSTELEKVRAALGKISLDAPRGRVRVDPANQRVVSDVLLGRVAADNGVDVVMNFGVVPAECEA